MFYAFYFSFLNIGVLTTYSPAATITPGRCLGYCRLMKAGEPLGRPHCSPASWFLELFTATVLFLIEQRCQPAEENMPI